MKFDLKEFQAAFDFVMKVVPKQAAPYMKKKALGVIIGTKGHLGAVQLTPRASRIKIMAVSEKAIAGVVISRAKKKGDWPLTKFEIDALVQKERMRRIKSIAYTAGPGWHNASVALGGTGIKNKDGGIQPGFHKSKAADGKATIPTAAYLTSVIENHAPAANLIGREALQQGIYNQAADMNAYGADQLLKPIFTKASAP